MTGAGRPALFLPTRRASSAAAEAFERPPSCTCNRVPSMEGERCSWPATRPIKIEHVAADDGSFRWIYTTFCGDDVAAILAVQSSLIGD